MKANKSIITTIVVAVLVGIPLAVVIHNKENDLKIQRSENSNMQMQVQKVESNSKSTEEALQRMQQEEEALRQENERLKTELQAKLERQEAERLAAEESKRKQAMVANAGGGCEAYRPLLAKYQWNVDEAMLVMQKESSCKPNAVSPTNDHGLFQINGGLQNYGNVIYEPEFNVKLAYEGFYAKRGWTPWYAVKGILW